MFRPPVFRAMRTLDRSIFRKTVPLKAARVFDNKNISKIRSELERSKDALRQERLMNVHPDPEPERAKAGKKCILLQPPEVATLDMNKASVAQTNGDADGSHKNDSGVSRPHSSTVTELVHKELISIIPFHLELTYDQWTYHDILSSILPEDEQGEIPSSFSQVGHVAHFNLRDQYVQYKHLIAEICRDKNPSVRTVISKIDDVGEENEYRTFKYEVLAGPDDLNVEISEENCVFKFDYSKVYWNTRLNTEHRRIITTFKEGEAVCDVMAGIGPFAVPAGKKNVFVWANDLNPDSYISLKDAVSRNKVNDYVKPFCEDGKSFIRTATAKLAKTVHKVDILSRKKDRAARPEVLRTLQQPKFFQHFVMNLPASALTFLPSFVGLYTSESRALLPEKFDMPLIHVYCFNTKSDDNIEESRKICEEISGYIGYEMTAGMVEDGGVDVHDVRDVAPNKRMFCATFRLPEEVAFRPVR